MSAAPLVPTTPPQPPRFRVMELPALRQDMVYKWDAEGEELFLPPKSYGPGTAKLPSWQTVTLVHW